MQDLVQSSESNSNQISMTQIKWLRIMKVNAILTFAESRMIQILNTSIIIECLWDL